MQLIAPRAVRRLVLTAGVAGLVLGALGTDAFAQSVKQMGTFRDWTVYSAAEGTGQICFAVSKPSQVVPQPDGYTQAYLYLTHRPAEKITNELNLVAGFTFAPDQPVTLTINGQTFPLFVQADAAWLEDPTQNDNLAGTMRAGTTVVVDGTSDKGVKIEETFSLAGATAASKAIDSSC